MYALQTGSVAKNANSSALLDTVLSEANSEVCLITTRCMASISKSPECASAWAARKLSIGL
jgi:hypothetical protein